MRFRLSLLMLLQWAIPGSVIPLLSVHLEHSLGFGRIETAWCCATQAVAAVVSSLLAGQVADRWFPAEKAMAVYAGLAGISLLLLAELTTPSAVFLGTLAFWLATGPMLLMGTTVCLSNLSDSPRQFGPIRMWGTVGWMLVGWIVTAWLRLSPNLFPDRVPPSGDSFRIGGAIAFALAAYALTLPSTPPRPRAGAGRWFAPLQAGRLFRGRPFFVYCLCLLGTCLTFPLTTQNTPLLLDQVGVPRAWIAAALTIAQTSEIVLLGVYPILLHRLGLRAMMSLGLAAWLIGLSILAVGHPTWLVLGSHPRYRTRSDWGKRSCCRNRRCPSQAALGCSDRTSRAGIRESRHRKTEYCHRTDWHRSPCRRRCGRRCCRDNACPCKCRLGSYMWLRCRN